MLVKRNEIGDVRGVHHNNNTWRNALLDTVWSIFPLFRLCRRYTSWYRSPLKRLFYLNVRFVKRLPSIYTCPVFHMIFLTRTSNGKRIFFYFSFPLRWDFLTIEKLDHHPFMPINEVTVETSHLQHWSFQCFRFTRNKIDACTYAYKYSKSNK